VVERDSSLLPLCLFRIGAHVCSMFAAAAEDGGGRPERAEGLQGERRGPYLTLVGEERGRVSMEHHRNNLSRTHPARLCGEEHVAVALGALLLERASADLRQHPFEGAHRAVDVL